MELHQEHLSPRYQRYRFLFSKEKEMIEIILILIFSALFGLGYLIDSFLKKKKAKKNSPVSTEHLKKYFDLIDDELGVVEPTEAQEFWVVDWVPVAHTKYEVYKRHVRRVFLTEEKAKQFKARLDACHRILGNQNWEKTITITKGEG